MRTLSEILVSAKNGTKPTHEECYWSMLVLDALNHFNYSALERLTQNTNELFDADFQLEEAFNREKAALDTCPKKWIGWSNDPANSAYQRERQVALKVFDKVLGRELA